MSPALVDLNSLLLAVPSLPAPQMAQFGEALYHKHLIAPSAHTGSLTAHDGELVLFHADRYHHAFHTSVDRARRPHAKDMVAEKRIARIPWIQPIIEGRARDTECWEVPLKVPEEGIRRLPGKRAYVSWTLGYIVWLEPRKKGGFKFSSAYPVPSGEIESYLTRARKLWP